MQCLWHALRFPYINQAMYDGIDDDVGQGTRMEFFHDVLAVADDRGVRDGENVGNFLVDAAFCQQPCHFHFAGGEDRLGGAFRPFLCRGMSHPSQCHKSLEHHFLALADVQRGHAADQHVAAHHDDAFLPSLAEEERMLKIDARGDEEVYELFAASLHKLLEGNVDAHFGRGYDAPQQLLQSESCQEIGVGHGDAEGLAMEMRAVCVVGMFHSYRSILPCFVTTMP